MSLRRGVKQIRSQLDRRTEERDSYAKQVKDLKEKKTAVTDELYDKYKAAADSRATGMSKTLLTRTMSDSRISAQDEVINTMQKINDKLSSRVNILEKELAAAKTVKVVEKEVKPQPDQDAGALKKLKAKLQAVEEESKQKDTQRELDFVITDSPTKTAMHHQSKSTRPKSSLLRMHWRQQTRNS